MPPKCHIHFCYLVGVGDTSAMVCPECEAEKRLAALASERTQPDAEDRITRRHRALKAIIAHWDEFGHEDGFSEVIDRARLALS